MAKPRRTLEELHLSGAFAKNPKRYAVQISEWKATQRQVGEPANGESPTKAAPMTEAKPLHSVQSVEHPAPASLSAVHEAIWNELAADLGSDRPASVRPWLRVAVMLRTKVDSGNAKPSEVAQYLSCLKAISDTPTHTTPAEKIEQFNAVALTPEEQGLAELDELDRLIALDDAERRAARFAESQRIAVQERVNALA